MKGMIRFLRLFRFGAGRGGGGRAGRGRGRDGRRTAEQADDSDTNFKVPTIHENYPSPQRLR